MPLVPPVTTATFPSSLRAIIVNSLLGEPQMWRSPSFRNRKERKFNVAGFWCRRCRISKVSPMFAKVAEERSFAAAARALKLSVPTVSRARQPPGGARRGAAVQPHLAQPRPHRFRPSRRRTRGARACGRRGGRKRSARIWRSAREARSGSPRRCRSACARSRRCCPRSCASTRRSRSTCISATPRSISSATVSTPPCASPFWRSPRSSRAGCARSRAWSWRRRPISPVWPPDASPRPRRAPLPRLRLSRATGHLALHRAQGRGVSRRACGAVARHQQRRDVADPARRPRHRRTSRFHRRRVCGGRAARHGCPGMAFGDGRPFISSPPPRETGPPKWRRSRSSSPSTSPIRRAWNLPEAGMRPGWGDEKAGAACNVRRQRPNER